MGPPRVFIPLLIFGVLGSGMANQFMELALNSLCQHVTPEMAEDPMFAPCVQRQGGDFVERFLKEKCSQNYSPWSFDNVKDSVGFFGNCLKHVIDVDQIEADLRKNRARSQLREVYKKYCLRAPILRECVKYTTDTIGTCLAEPEERKTATIINNMLNALLEFVCQDDGARIAIFEEPYAVECIEFNKHALLRCANETFGSYIPPKGYFLSETERLGRLATPLIPSEEDCANLDSFQNCSIGVLLSECRNQGPVNLLNSLLNSIRMETPCNYTLEIEDSQLTTGNFSYENETEVTNTRNASEYTVNTERNTFTSTFREKCEYNGGFKAYKIAKKVPQHLEDCFKSLINTTELEGEVAEAAPTGDLDVVFAKYCRKVPNLKKCVRQATKSIKSCLDPEVQPKVDVINNITRALLRFSCYGDGDRLAQFFSTGGPQCIESQAQALKSCGTQIFRKYDPPLGYDEYYRFEAMLTLASQDCANVKEFQRCTVKALRRCDDPSTAETVGSLIESLIKSTPCKNVRRG